MSMAYEYIFNSPDALPPVDTELLILVDGKAVQVKRTGYIQNKDDLMEYETANGRKFYGRFPWTYK